VFQSKWHKPALDLRTSFPPLPVVRFSVAIPGFAHAVDAGPYAFNNVVLNMGYYAGQDVDAGITVVAGALTINEVGSITGTIHAQGDVLSNDVGVGGTGQIVMDGGNSATISGLDLPDGGLVINKPVGKSVALGSNLSGVSSLLLQSGTLDLGGYALAVGSGGMKVYAAGTLAFTVSTPTTQLTVNGNLKFYSNIHFVITDGGLASPTSSYVLIAVVGGNTLSYASGNSVVAPPTITVTGAPGVNGTISVQKS